MNFPTYEQVEKATDYQLGKWHRFLPVASNELESASLSHIHQRFTALGGWTPALSKDVGWDPPFAPIVRPASDPRGNA